MTLMPVLPVAVVVISTADQVANPAASTVQNLAESVGSMPLLWRVCATSRPMGATESRIWQVNTFRGDCHAFSIASNCRGSASGDWYRRDDLSDGSRPPGPRRSVGTPENPRGIVRSPGERLSDTDGPVSHLATCQGSSLGRRPSRAGADT